MVHPNQADIALAGLAEILTTAFPDAGPVAPLRVLGEGFRSLAVETASGVVFLIARNAVAGAGQALEWRLLPRLHSFMRTPIPRPLWRAGPCERFTYGVIGYRKLAGQPLRPERIGERLRMGLAQGIAAFLLDLQRFSTEAALRLGVPGLETRRADWEVMRGEVLPALGEVLSAHDTATVTRWWEELMSDQRMESFRPTLVHGDLWYENLLVDETAAQLTGVVDFEHAMVGDLAQDFATLLHLGKSFADQVIVDYRVGGGDLDEGFDHRRRRLWELREFNGIQFALRTNDQAEFTDAVRKLRAGPLFNRQK